MVGLIHMLSTITACPLLMDNRQGQSEGQRGAREFGEKSAAPAELLPEGLCLLRIPITATFAGCIRYCFHGSEEQRAGAPGNR